MNPTPKCEIPHVRAHLHSALGNKNVMTQDAAAVTEIGDTFAHQLSMLRAAEDSGQIKKIRPALHKVLTSFEGRYWAVVRTAQKRGWAMTHAEIESAAEALDLWQPCFEKICRWSKPKLGGGERMLFSFGPERTARQHLCAAALLAMNAPSRHCYTIKGRGGWQAAVARVFELRAQGYGWYVVADAKNFFDSLSRKGVKERLHPFPTKVVDHSIALPRVGVYTGFPGAPKAVSQTQPTKKPARLGAPQGAVTSGLVASACLVPELDQLAERGPVVCHGDDLLIAAKTKQDALDLREQLRQLLADHPAGPLFLKHCHVKNGKHGYGFDFLQYHFEQENPYFGTKFRARPAKSAFQRMQCRVIQTYWENRHLPEAEREARVWAYAHRWQAAFKPHWDQNEFNYELFLYTVEEALDYAVQTSGETAA